MVTVRAARPDDQPLLIQLTARLADFALPPWRTAAEIAAADHEILLDALHSGRKDAAIFVAERDASTGIGYVFATSRRDYFTGRPHAHVENLAVDEGAQGQGAARALMQAIERWAAGLGYQWITLNVFASNHRARGFYEHLGYDMETLQYRKPLAS